MISIPVLIVIIYLVVAFTYGAWTGKSTNKWVRLSGNSALHIIIAIVAAIIYNNL
ncbi:hypothetical protein YDYSG_12320 [Paenibacillus tyrfis]|nr:hypothetical protein YDYSG_12320 [Paenibacillus tyrfis]GMX64059.1 hypothetical protein Elgi_33840 [Paenibacillus elgii]